MNLDNAYGNGVYDQFQAQFTKLGGTIAGEIAYDETASSFGTEVTQVKNSGADGVVIVAYPTDAALIFAEADSQSVDLPWFGTDGIASSSVVNNTGIRDYLDGRLFGTTPASGTDPGGNSKYQQFLYDLGNTSGSYGIFGDYVYDAFLVAAAGINAAGSYNGENIRDGIYAAADGLQGATGADKSFNCDGEPLSQAYDFWNASSYSVTTEVPRALEFTGLGDKAIAPCGDHPYVPPTSSTTTGTGTETSTSGTGTETSSTSSGTGTTTTTTTTTSEPPAAPTPGFELLAILSLVGTAIVVINRRKK